MLDTLWRTRGERRDKNDYISEIDLYKWLNKLDTASFLPFDLINFYFRSYGDINPANFGITTTAAEAIGRVDASGGATRRSTQN